jgi:REP element-mobilizing transposase RayT
MFRRLPLLCSQEAVAILREAIRAEKLHRPFQIDAMGILPDHIHAIWTLPPDDGETSNVHSPNTQTRSNVPPYQAAVNISANGIWNAQLIFLGLTLKSCHSEADSDLQPPTQFRTYTT